MLESCEFNKLLLYFLPSLETLLLFKLNYFPPSFKPTFSPSRSEKVCYAKLVCLKTENNKVIGFHYLGPNAGEVTQGYAGMVQLGKLSYCAVILDVKFHNEGPFKLQAVISHFQNI